MNDHKYDNLVKVYYKTMSVFLFVYSISDKESFLMIQDGIDTVMTEINKEKFVGILIGTYSSKDQLREVSYDDGENLRKKFNLSLFLEANPNENSLKDSLGKFMQTQIKNEKPTTTS